MQLQNRTQKIKNHQAYIQLIISLQFSILAKKKPFRVGVKFDETEICTAAAGNTCEWDTIPGGIIGFKLIYWQVAC